MTIPREVEDAIYRHVRRDLAPSAARVHALLAGSVGLGGLVSLFLCGQFGVGMTAAAGLVHGAIMARTGMTGCAAICGVLFAVVPVLALRAACRPLLFRVLVTRHFAAGAGWLALTGAALAGAGRTFTLGGAGFGQELLVWCAAAVAAWQLYARAVDRFSSSHGRL